MLTVLKVVLPSTAKFSPPLHVWISKRVYRLKPRYTLLTSRSPNPSVPRPFPRHTPEFEKSRSLALDLKEKQRDLMLSELGASYFSEKDHCENTWENRR